VTAPEFLDVDDVIALHDALLEEHGGQAGIRDRGLLESAVAMPMATFDGVFLHQDLFDMAAAYAFHIAESQAFVDGNKRAAIGAAIVFLDMNGVDVPEATETLHQAMLDVAARHLDKAGLASVLRGLVARP
jgi:death on curing protein